MFYYRVFPEIVCIFVNNFFTVEQGKTADEPVFREDGQTGREPGFTTENSFHAEGRHRSETGQMGAEKGHHRRGTDAYTSDKTGRR